MSNKPKKWPDYALGSLEGTLMHLKTVEKLSREIQAIGKAMEQPQLVIIGGDARAEALSAIDLLRQARTGDYEI